jgi:hypothetical protein
MVKFNIGDIVKVIAGRTNSSKVYAGQIGRILKISPNNGIGAHCLLDIDFRGGGIFLAELELVEKAEQIKPQVYGIVKFLESINARV